MSELIKRQVDVNVLAFVEKLSLGDIGIAVITITELRIGALTHKNAERGTVLQSKINGFLNSIPTDNILALNRDAAEICAQLMADKKAETPQAKYADFLLAAIAMSRKIPIATRNIRDFQHKGLEVINPWVV